MNPTIGIHSSCVHVSSQSNNLFYFWKIFGKNNSIFIWYCNFWDKTNWLRLFFVKFFVENEVSAHLFFIRIFLFLVFEQPMVLETFSGLGLLSHCCDGFGVWISCQYIYLCFASFVSGSNECCFWLEDEFELNMSLTDADRIMIVITILEYLGYLLLVMKKLCTMDFNWIGMIGNKQWFLKHWHRFELNQDHL